MTGSIALAAAAAFNLVCNGTLVLGKVGDDGTVRASKESPLHEEFRIDLTAGRWCTGVCADTTAIIAVEGDILWLSRGGMLGVEISIDRASGTYARSVAIANIVSKGTGTCTQAPFSGFPSK